MPALSTVSSQFAGSAPSAAPGLFELGSAWQTTRGVLIVAHGRDRPSDELPVLLADLARQHGCRILAPVAAGLSWYPGRHDTLEGNGPGRAAALEQIDNLMALANRHGVADDRIVLVGFSQGGCIVTEYLLWGDKCPGAAAVFTGCALSIPADAYAGHCQGIEVLMTSGKNDPWLPLDDLFVAADALERAGARVKREIFSDQDHIVRPREIELLGELLKHLLSPEK